jgi:hypothetical protein
VQLGAVLLGDLRADRGCLHTDGASEVPALSALII